MKMFERPIPVGFLWKEGSSRHPASEYMIITICANLRNLWFQETGS